MYRNATQNIQPIVRKASDFVKSNPVTTGINIEPEAVLPKSYGPDRQFWLYALKLEHGKYYVGYTGFRNPYNRIMQHVEALGEGARWTELHKPVEVVEVRDLGVTSSVRAKALEQNLTWTYMKHYGANNVRGGRINYTGRVIRIGDKLLMGYMLDSFISAFLVMGLSAYILWRHYFNGW